MSLASYPTETDIYRWENVYDLLSMKDKINEGSTAVQMSGRLLGSGSLLLGPNNLQEIRDACAEHRTLQALGFSDCAEARGESLALFNIFISTCVYPATRRDAHASLVYLRMENCGLADIDVEAFVDVIQSNCSLKYLSLYHNDITDGGVAMIADALTTNDSLLSLSLQRNHITDKGVNNLADTLKVNWALKFLDLRLNDVTDKGYKHLIEALKVNDCIIDIPIFSPSVRKKYSNKLREMLQQNENSIVNRADAEKKEFINVFKKELKGAWKRSKIMVVGQGQAGKTSTVRSLLGKDFDPLSSSTLGAEVTYSQVKRGKGPRSYESSEALTWKEIKEPEESNAASLAVEMVISQLKSRKHESQGKTTSSNTSAFSTITRDFVKTIKKAKSRLSIFSQVSDIVENEFAFSEELIASDDIDSSFALDVGNVSVEEENGVKSYGYNINLFNPKPVRDIESNMIKFSIWDFGGQSVFYSLHHLFLTKNGAYLLVFNAKKYLEEQTQDVITGRGDEAEDDEAGMGDNSEEYIKFWLHSCKMHAPGAPIFLVATYCDELEQAEDIMSVNNRLTVLLGDQFPEVIMNDSHSLLEPLLFFPIDNQSGFGVTDLQKKVAAVSSAQDHVSLQVNVWWMKCLDEIFSSAREKKWLRRKEILEIARRNRIANSAEVDEMLSLFHELGVITYLTATENLRDIVTINPQWLLSSLSKLIHDSEIHGLNQLEVKNLGLEHDVKNAYTYGIASMDLLEFVWREEKENIGFLLDLMKHTILLSEWKHRKDSNVLETNFLVPSLLKPFSRPKPMGGYLCAFDFSESFLPIGVYDRLLCLLTAHSVWVDGSDAANDENNLYANWAEIFIQAWDTGIQMEREKSRIVVTVSCSSTAGTVLQMLESMLTKINNEVMNQGLRYKVMFTPPTPTNGSSQLMEYEEAKEQKLSPWFSEGGETGAGSALAVSTFDMTSFLQSI